jgi:hypothetical protein
LAIRRRREPPPFGSPGGTRRPSNPSDAANTGRFQVVRVGTALVTFKATPDNASFGAEFVPDAVVKAQVDKLLAAAKG